MECKSNGDKNRILSVKEYLNKIRPYLKTKTIINIINNLEKSGT